MLKFLYEHIGNIDVFSTTDTGSSVGDCISNERVGKVTLRDYYTYEKGRKGIIKYMTADEYIDNCIKKIFHSDYKRTVDNAVDWEKVNKYAKAMKNGEKFPLPYLDYVSKQQEGRHRALAYKQAFGDNAEFPVLEIFPTDEDMDSIADYCKRKWGNIEMWLPYVASGLGKSEREINDYLGIETEETVEDEETFEPDDLSNIDDLLSAEDLVDEEIVDFDENDLIDFINNHSKLNIKSLDDLNTMQLVKWLERYYDNR